MTTQYDITIRDDKVGRSQLQERIARAIEEAERKLPFGAGPEYSRRSYAELALAVMKAMREPTTPMIEAGGNYVLQEGGIDPMHVDDRGPPYCIKGRETGSYELWRVMVAAEISLAEGGSNDRD